MSTAVTVDFSTSDVYLGPSPAAQAGVHYQAQSGTLTFQPGEWIKTIQIGIIDNPDINQAHGFQVFSLYNPVGGVLDVSGPSYAYVQIYDNELPNLVDASFNTGSGLESYDESFGMPKPCFCSRMGKFSSGDFNTVSGNLRKGLARLNGNGSYDTNLTRVKGSTERSTALGSAKSTAKLWRGVHFYAPIRPGIPTWRALMPDGTVDGGLNPYTDETGEFGERQSRPWQDKILSEELSTP